MKNSIRIEVKILKIILGTYIGLSILIAGLNYGYVDNAPPSIASFITWFWHFYENWIKTLFIIVGGFLTFRIIKSSRRTRMVKQNLIGFLIAALVVHIIGPIVTGNSELYFFSMPLPFTTTPLQLLYPQSSFYTSRFPVWGLTGVSIAIIFFLAMSVIVVIGTLLIGRRWQCSTICLFNGFAAEVFGPAVPLIGKKKKMSANKLKLFSVLRWVFLAIAIFFTAWWVLFLLKVPLPGNFELLSSIEVYKYLTADLLMMMFFWVAFMARGYCYYCPLGTVVAGLSKLAGQKIKTDNSSCIECNRCNNVCPMSIDIKAQAVQKKPVTSIRCVGCGHCIDACPTKTLSYSTRFTEWFNKKTFSRVEVNSSNKKI